MMNKLNTELVTLDTSSIHNKGLYARVDIPEDTPIIQYIGRKITQKQADKLAEKQGETLIYLFELNDCDVIDGDTSDNLAKYINHSCDPNCYNDIIDDEIWIYAMRDIKKGEELSYDYGFQRQDWHKRPCRCGAKNCFGFLVARSYWSAIKRTKRYQTLTKQPHKSEPTGTNI